jgi:hypothetical protein
LAAFSTALSGAFVAYSTSLVISTACRKKIGVTCATSYVVPDPPPQVSSVHIGQARLASWPDL